MVILILYIYKGEHLHDVHGLKQQGSVHVHCTHMATPIHSDPRPSRGENKTKSFTRQTNSYVYFTCFPFKMSILYAHKWSFQFIDSLCLNLAGIMSTTLLHTELNSHGRKVIHPGTCICRPLFHHRGAMPAWGVPRHHIHNNSSCFQILQQSYWYMPMWPTPIW